MSQNSAAIGAQAEVLAYRGGRLAVGAVPGAGKTHVLTMLLAELATAPDAPARPHHTLVLTYMRSAVAEFRRRAHEALAQRGATAYGLSVSTLHGFAAKVLFEAEGGEDESGAPALVVWSEAEQAKQLQAALESAMAQGLSKAAFEEAFGPWEGEPNSRRKAGKDVAAEVATRALEQLRRQRKRPEEAWEALEGVAEGLGLWLVAYERERRRRRALDYDGLVAAATDRLERDEPLRKRLQRKHRLVIEDEAQDATPLQLALVERLVAPEWGGSGHWVRVGDPNQAIMGFAGSDAAGFRAWVLGAEREGQRVSMDQAGRCAEPILDVANAFVKACRAHPDPRVAGALDAHATIHPVLEGVRANPQAWAMPRFKVHPDPESERQAVLSEVASFLGAHPQATAAILVRTNAEADAIRSASQHLGLPMAEGMPTGPRMKATLLAVAAALRCLALPSGKALPQALSELSQALALLDGGPSPGPLWPGVVGLLGQSPPYRELPEGVAAESYDAALAVAEALAPWWPIRHLPPDELAPGLAFELAKDPEAAWWVTQAISEVQRPGAYDPPAPQADPRLTMAWRLAHQALESSKREPPSAEAPRSKPGLVVRTMHRAKGAEYDGVWLVGLMDAKDEVLPWEARKLWAGRAVVLKLLALLEGRPYHQDAAAEASRVQSLTEGFRLLYVGLTRAKRVLRLSGNHPASVPPLGPHREALAKACGGLAS